MEDLEDEYEYVVLRDDIAKLKRVYLNDIRNSVLLSETFQNILPPLL